jgi:hypothetical protein
MTHGGFGDAEGCRVMGPNLCRHESSGLEKRRRQLERRLRSSMPLLMEPRGALRGLGLGQSIGTWSGRWSKIGDDEAVDSTDFYCLEVKLRNGRFL